MKTSILVLAALVVVAFSSVAFAVNATISPVTINMQNATVNSNGTAASGVSAYNISFMFTAVTDSIYSINFTFPADTRFNNTNLPAFGGGGSSTYYNITSNVSGSVANWTSLNGTLRISNATGASGIDVIFNTTGNVS